MAGFQNFKDLIASSHIMVKAVSLFQAMVDGNGGCQGEEERKDMGRKEGMGKQSWVWVLGRSAGATETIKQNS